MSDKVDSYIDSFKPLRTNIGSFLILVVPLIVLGILSRKSYFKEWSDFLVFGAIFLPIGLLMLFAASQVVTVDRESIVIRKLFRKPRRFTWDDIVSFNYNRWLRYVTIRDKNGLIYFNSTDALSHWGDLFVILGLKTGYRCSDKLRRELEDCWKTLSQ